MNHITAADLDYWGTKYSARGELPILVRRLIHETVREPPKICDFPSGSGIDLPGHDGVLDAVSGNSWVPTGHSVWELSTKRDIAEKANEDIEKRTNEKRSSATFLFVTPRRWPGKKRWIEQAKSRNVGWKDIRAYDASDLEQWLETGRVTTVWFHEEQLGNSVDGTQSLSRAWEEWAQATNPEFPSALMCASREDAIRKLYKFLSKPAGRTITVVGDTREEAIAFIAAALKEDEQLRELMPDGLVIRDKTVAAQKTTELLVMASSEISRHMPRLPSHSHVLIAEARGNIQAGIGESNIIFLHRILPQAFNELVEKHNFVDARCDAEQLGRETGYSLSALRRQFAKNDALKNPPWATPETAKNLFPLALIGGWDENYEGDKDVIKHLAKDHDAFLDTAQSLADAEETPLETVGTISRIRSRLDAFTALGKRLTTENMDEFFSTTQTILSLADPGFTLPPEARWAANIYNKERRHSSFLRHGITDSLILFAMYDSVLPSELRAQGRVKNLVEGLLQDATKERWYALRDILPSLAEASPDVFLEVLENDLRQTERSVSSLFLAERDPLVGDHYQYEGLLRALEIIAWHPDRLIPAVRILGQLMKLFESHIADNCYYRPQKALAQILKSWMPQTAATINQRLEALDILCSQFPSQGAEIAIEFISPGNKTGHYSARPRWRDDARGHGEPNVNREDRVKMEQATVEQLLNIIERSNLSPEETLSLCTRLISHIDSLGPDYSSRLFEITGKKWSTWDNKGQVDLQREILRHLHWYAVLQRKKGDSAYDKDLQEALKQFYETLEFRSPVQKHAWLFVHRPPFPDEYIQDIEEEDKEAGRRRQSAIAEIFGADGHAGIVELCKLLAEISEIYVVSNAVRESIRRKNIDTLSLTELVRESVQSDLDKPRLAYFLSCLFWEEEPNRIIELARAVCGDDMSFERRTALLHAIPLSQETWEYVDEFGTQQVDAYWGEPRIWTPELKKPEILKHVVKEYLDRRLPKLAFNAAEEPAHHDPEQLLEILTKWGTPAGDVDRSPANPDIWRLQTAIEHLSGKIPDEKLWVVEFKFYLILEHTDYEAKTIYKTLSREPGRFVELLEYRFKKREDMPELPDEEIHRGRAQTARSILLDWKGYFPGQQENGTINPGNLQEWISTAQKLCEQKGIKGIGDETIGKILACAPEGSDGLHPCEPVRDFLETANQDILTGFEFGIRNSRGVTWSSGDGEQERDLVQQYNESAKKFFGRWPRTSRVMRQVADSYEDQARWYERGTRVRNLCNYE